MIMDHPLRQLAGTPPVGIEGKSRAKKDPSLLLGQQPMNKFVAYRKLVKYSALRQLPGKLGRRYEYKYLRLQALMEFEEAIHRSKGMTCIDLGANIGEYTRKMALGTKQVIAFEPDPWAHAELQTNVADLDNVKIENSAAGTSESMVLLYRHARFDEDPTLNSQSSSVISGNSNLSEVGAVEIQQVDFIKYLEDLNEDIGLLKMDIEGAEVDLLEALFDRPDILNRIDHIFAETHERLILGYKLRVNALRERAKLIKQPYINLYWH